MLNNLIDLTKKVQTDLLIYQQQYDKIKEKADEIKGEVQSELSLKINDQILQSEINALEDLNQLEKGSNEFIDKLTNLNKNILDFTEDANNMIIGSLKDSAVRKINDSNLIKDENKIPITERAVRDLENLQASLEILIRDNKQKWNEMNLSSKKNVKETGEKIETLVSKAGDFTEDLSNKLIY
ncbi:hypothetical protein MY04_0415 [Flammeovirga sp. MY04]|uniref:hypothetical protein n=1 Tax=Flammeovirga sp. MY04 TaxID=1191459 RepID=UPI0008061EE5|nr:hypothetical protein [Flammeovirga sp. MY04]ANQ47797.1 hypothetical protein MY04_0415 [Flammeovirga sp. MY04]